MAKRECTSIRPMAVRRGDDDINTDLLPSIRNGLVLGLLIALGIGFSFAGFLT